MFSRSTSDSERIYYGASTESIHMLISGNSSLRRSLDRTALRGNHLGKNNKFYWNKILLKLLMLLLKTNWWNWGFPFAHFLVLFFLLLIRSYLGINWLLYWLINFQFGAFGLIIAFALSFVHISYLLNPFLNLLFSDHFEEIIKHKNPLSQNLLSDLSEIVPQPIILKDNKFILKLGKVLVGDALVAILVELNIKEELLPLAIMIKKLALFLKLNLRILEPLDIIEDFILHFYFA